MLPVSEDVLSRETCLPIFADISEEMIDNVIKCIRMELK